MIIIFRILHWGKEKFECLVIFILLPLQFLSFFFSSAEHWLCNASLKVLTSQSKLFQKVCFGKVFQTLFWIDFVVNNVTPVLSSILLKV